MESFIMFTISKVTLATIGFKIFADIFAYPVEYLFLNPRITPFTPEQLVHFIMNVFFLLSFVKPFNKLSLSKDLFFLFQDFHARVEKY